MGRDGVLFLNGDEIDVRNIFENINTSRLKSIIGQHRYVVIDEAQRISDVGLKFKLITDQMPTVQLIASGSSAFELANKLNEPLTGRKWEYQLFPLSFSEMVNHHGWLEESRMIPHRLLYGYYPDVVNQPGSEKEVLKQLSDSFLYKDILLLDQVKRPESLVKLLQALAFQVGSQVSYSELSQVCSLDVKTIEKYITLLEQSYVIFRLGSLSRNLRSELKRSRKIYFYDNGIRNALIANFNQIENRTDVGALWENFLISERKKFNHYSGRWSNSWFWRTIEQTEVDYVEEMDGKMIAYEFKWSSTAKWKVSKTFTNAYPDAEVEMIHQNNFYSFLGV
jgi:predicted AAA+ superfamily ATPase